MKRILVANAVLFPVVFVVIVIGTGTWRSAVWPRLEREVRARVGMPTEAAPAVWGVVDSLMAADLTRREARVQAELDSLAIERARLDTERHELATLAGDIDRRLAALSEAEASAEAETGEERRALARVFAEINPDAAGKVLRHLDEASLEYLIRTLQRRRAAALLAELEPEIAARLSQRVLNPTDGDDGKEQP